MRYLKLFEAFGIEGPLSSTPPQNLEEQIAFSMRWYPGLYDSKFGRQKVLNHMYLGYGTEYEWVDGELANVGDPDLNTDYGMYEYRYKVWQSRKKDGDARLERLMDHYEKMCKIVSKSSRPSDRKYLKDIQDEINELQDEMDNFNPHGKEYPDSKPLDVDNLYYSTNYSPIFKIPKNTTQEYLEGAKEIVKYIMDNTTNDEIRKDLEPIAKKLNVIS